MTSELKMLQSELQDNRFELVSALFDSRSQLQRDQIEWIVRACGERLSGSALVFGLGYDSMLWSKLSNTIFIEDNARWYKRIFSEPNSDCLHAYLVNYNTQVKTWRRDLRQRKTTTLPPEVESQQFDAVIIDGPRGSRRQSPGRVSSILIAQQLVKDGGIIVLNDLSRNLEKNVASQILGEPSKTFENRSLLGSWEF